jgi:hypothetical protein
MQKGHIYYRCHTRGCRITCLREEVIETAVLQMLAPLQFTPKEKVYIEQNIDKLKEEWRGQEEAQSGASCGSASTGTRFEMRSAS